MGDVGEFWRDVGPGLREASRAKKKRNQCQSDMILQSHDIQFESHNDGLHLVVSGSFDFWPSTGKFIDRKTGKSGRGIFNLLKRLKNVECD